MKAEVYRWDNLPQDDPIPLLHRAKFEGRQALLANVHLTQGCQVEMHSHESEQIAVILSGRAKWTLGAEKREIVVGAGEIVHLPSNEPHAVEALEDTHVLDILSPPGPMGIDRQR